jgi:hypothetical protein
MQEPKQNSFFDTLKFLSIPFCGGLATYLGDIISYPFETITTSIKKLHSPQGFYKEILNNLQTKNWYYFFNGINTVFYSAFFTNFVYFGVYEGLNRYSYKKLKSLEMTEYNWAVPTVSSLIGETASLAVFVPVDCIQTRIQTGYAEYNYNGLMDGLRKIIKFEGYRRLFTGAHVYMMHNLLFMPIIFTIYEKYKKLIIEHRRQRYIGMDMPVPDPKNMFGIFDSIKGTLLATTASTIITNPMYTILVRFQITDYSQSQYMKERVWYIVKSSYRLRGFRGLNVGLLPRLLTTNISAVVYLPVYEFVRTIFGHESEI